MFCRCFDRFDGVVCVFICLLCAGPDYYFLLIGKVLRFTTESFRPIVLPFNSQIRMRGKLVSAINKLMHDQNAPNQASSTIPYDMMSEWVAP